MRQWGRPGLGAPWRAWLEFAAQQLGQGGVRDEKSFACRIPVPTVVPCFRCVAFLASQTRHLSLAESTALLQSRLLSLSSILNRSKRRGPVCRSPCLRSFGWI